MNFEKILKAENDILPNLKYLFTAYLHQDWDIEGRSLLEIFQNHTELQGLCRAMNSEVALLRDSELSNEELDQLFIDTWASGYEPDDRADEDWHSTLLELSDICHHYTR